MATKIPVKIYNTASRNLIVLAVSLRDTSEAITYLFPMNPGSLSINQASRISSTFTYGAKVFQNLGAGLKTLSIEGHTGYRLSKDKYGIQGGKSDLAYMGQDLSPKAPPQDGKMNWLDLYALIQLIKGENKFISQYDTISEDFKVDNIEQIESVKITIPDQGITYDVMLQNDSFSRNREQPHLYKYKLDFIIIQESFGAGDISPAAATFIDPPTDIVNRIKAQANALTAVTTDFFAESGIQTMIGYYNDAVDVVNVGVEWGNLFVNAANSTVSDLRRLEKMSDALEGVVKGLSSLRHFVLQMKTFSNLQTAFYEPIIRLKNISAEFNLLTKSMTGSKKQLEYNVNMTRLASVYAPVTIAANKATVAQFQIDIRQLNHIAFPLPVEKVKEITTSGKTKINILFKDRPSSLGVARVRVFASNDFGNETDLVESSSDTGLILSTSYNETGYSYNFIIEYNYNTFESIVQTRYKSIKRILITKGETLESLVKKYAPKEANASRTYLSEIAYLNDVEYPYIVTSDNPNFEAYFGSYGYKIFTSTGEFTRYINNIDIDVYPGQVLPVYDTTDTLASNYVDVNDPAVFLLQQQEVIDQILIESNTKFFVLLFKETYSNRCYALFGIFLSTNIKPYTLFNADSYVICALQKGRSYDVDNNSIFEILSPYTSSGDLIEYYGQTALFDENSLDSDITLWSNLVSVIDQIYIQNVGSFVPVDAFPFTEDDKTFLAGDEDNKNYVILTSFAALGTPTGSSYTITAFSAYRVLIDGEELLLPSFENKFLPFAEAFTKEDTYKVDLDVRFQYLDDTHVSILPRPDLGPGPTGQEQGYLDFRLISGLPNVKQALKNRLECPQGGLILHRGYGLPVLLGKKNTLEHLILLRYNLFNQLKSDPRVRAVNNIQLKDVADTIDAQTSIVLVNNDNVLIKTTL